MEALQKEADRSEQDRAHEQNSRVYSSMSSFDEPSAGEQEAAADQDEAVRQKLVPDEAFVVSQALAFRPAEAADAKAIAGLLAAGYAAEHTGKEAFRRQGGDATADDVSELLAGGAYEWLLCEAANGRGVEQDGALLGLCAYGTGGVSRRNGAVEGKLASVRFVCVRPRYQRFCVGRRLMARAESAMAAAGCVRCMLPVASPRTAMAYVALRLGYAKSGECPYPDPGAVTVAPDDGGGDVHLMLYTKTLAPAIEVPGVD